MGQQLNRRSTRQTHSAVAAAFVAAELPLRRVHILPLTEGARLEGPAASLVLSWTAEVTPAHGGNSAATNAIGILHGALPDWV